MDKDVHGKNVAFSLDRPAAGMENGIGKFFQGLGPGPDGPEKPIPLLLQVLDPHTYALGFDPGDLSYQVLSNDQNRFALPKALPPVLTLLEPGDYDNPDGCHIVARHAYSQGAFLLLHDLLETGFRFTLKEFLKLAQSCGEVLAFLHSQGIVHGQWNPRSILCIPEPTSGSPFDEARSYRYHVLNTGIRYRNPEAIPREFLDRGYFPREIFSPSNQLPDYEAYDLEADVYSLAACLKDIFQRASCFEELTTQAIKIRDHFHREAIRRGQEPNPDRLRQKEQEILDHLYTFKVKSEDMIQSGLRDRGERSNAAALWESSRGLYRKTLEYADKLLEVGFGSINIFGEDLRRYVPYQIKLEPRFVNSFDDNTVTLTGADMPYEVVRVTLGEANRPLEVVEATPSRIRFRVPRGFTPGNHQILINNQRTSDTLKVISPTWKHLLPDKVRKPWPGFGNIVVRVVGRDLPSSPFFSLDLKDGGELEAVQVHPETAQEERAEGFADERVGPEEEALVVQFPPETPVGAHALRCKGLETGLRISIEDVLPDPVMDREGIDPREVLNHREQTVHLRGRNFHEAMTVDLGEDAPAQVQLHYQGERSAVITVPAGCPAGEYTLRLNHAPTSMVLVVREPRWASLEPTRLNFGGKGDKPRDLQVAGEHLPALDQGAGEVYRLRTARGRELSQGVLEAEEGEPGAVHRLRVSPDLPRGSLHLSFGGRDTGLELRVSRKLSPAARWGIKAGVFAGLILLALVVVERSRPRIDSLETPVVFNFGEAPVLLVGERILGVVLRDGDGRELGTYAVEPVRSEGGAEGGGTEPTGRFSFRSTGIPAGEYTVISRRGILRGRKTVKLEVRSPRFEISPRTLNRLLNTDLVLRSGTDFPIQDVKKLSLAVQPPVEPEGRKDGKDAREAKDTKGGKDGKIAAKAGKDGKAEGKAEKEGKGVAKNPAPPLPPPRDFTPGVGGKLQIKPGTFGRDQEGVYEVLLDGVPLAGQFTGDSQPLTVQVVGPRVSSATPNPVTLKEGGAISIRLKGENLPTALPLALLKEGKQDQAAFVLQPGADGFEGRAEPGKFLAAWDFDRGKLETIPGISLDVFPPPEVLEISPAVVEPGQKVELTIRGVNLKEARTITLQQLSKAGEAIRVSLDPERVKQEESRSEYVTEPLTFQAGTYAVFPGERAFLEVVEDCRKLLDGYRKDLAGLDRLTDCLAERHAREEVRREAADIFFDQGLHGEALELYQRLEDLKSRFRAAFLSRHAGTGEGAGGRGGPAAFSVRPDEPKSDPYYRAAVALGWVAGQTGPPPADTGSTWDLDFVRGSLAEDPQVGVESLELSIEKKRTAAVVKEVQPFAPAFGALAAARLRVVVSKLRTGDPVQVRDDLRKLFFDAGENYQLLSPAERAKSCFFYGHTLLWTSMDEEKAVQVFTQGLKEGEAAEGSGEHGSGEHGALCQLYLQALGASVAPGAPALAAGNGWELAFLALLKHYRKVRNTPNYNILTERYDFGSPLYPEERKESLDLHQAIKRLEAATEVTDPFAHHALLFQVRNAQLLSWPGQEGGLKAREHREKLLSMKLEGEAALLRDFYLLEGEVGPLERAQVSLLDYNDALGTLKRVGSLLKGGLQEPVLGRLRALEKKLQRS